MLWVLAGVRGWPQSQVSPSGEGAVRRGSGQGAAISSRLALIGEHEIPDPLQGRNPDIAGLAQLLDEVLIAHGFDAEAGFGHSVGPKEAVDIGEQGEPENSCERLKYRGEILPVNPTGLFS